MAFPADAFADTLFLKNGGQVKGRIIADTQRSVTLDINGSTVDFDHAEIARIEREPGSLPVKVHVSSSPVQVPTKFGGTLAQIPSIRFDGRPWKLGFQDSNPRGMIQQYVLDGETVERWTELVVAQLFLTGPNADIPAYVSKSKDSIRTACPSNTWNDIEASPVSCMYEWSIRQCQGEPDQSEITRVMASRDGVLVFRYAIRKVPMPDDRRRTWTEALKNIRLDQGR